jgi:hypothetical protein
MNYNTLILFFHKLSIMILDLIKLSSYDTFSHSVSQRDGQRRENFFFSIFAPTLGGYKCHFSDLKCGQKWKKKFSLLTVSFNPFD